jgi:hypothetical protein
MAAGRFASSNQRRFTESERQIGQFPHARVESNAPRSREKCNAKSRAVGLEHIRIGGAHVDVAAAVGDERVDERRQTRRTDPFGACEKDYGLRRSSTISRWGIGGLRLHIRRGGRASVLGGDRAPRGEHGLEVGDEGRG